MTLLGIAGYGSELRTDFQFGNTYGIGVELYKRFNQTSRWFFAPRASASDSAQWIYSHNNPQAELTLLDLLCELDSRDRYHRIVESLEFQYRPDSLIHSDGPAPPDY